jgi:hypothetical protein
VNTIYLRILVLGIAFAFLGPTVRSEQPQKASRPTQEDRISKLEERVGAAEKAASSAAMEKDYITRSQKLYESYYPKVLNIQMWAFGIMGLILIAVFVLAARFSLKMIDEQTKTATAQATVQMRNEYARTLAKEVQKLWDSNVVDIKKLKEALTAQISELERNAKEKSDFQTHFVQALAVGVERPGDSVLSFRNALGTYKSGKPRKLIDSKVGATTVRYVFESLRKKQGEDYVEKASEELADPLYNDLDEELALAALQIPWLTPLINERRPVTPEPELPMPESTVELHSPAPVPDLLPAEPGLPVDEESDSCRLVEK